MRANRILLGTVLVGFLAGTTASAQLNQPMRGRVKRVALTDIFGVCQGGANNACRLHYEYWSDGTNPAFPQSGSGQVNRADAAQGVPAFVPLGTPPGSSRGDYRASLLVAGNFPGALAGQNWYGQWYAYQDPGTANYVGYYALHGQIVDFGEFGNDQFFDCVGALPIACFPPPGPDNPTVPPPNRIGHSVFRADGSEVTPLGGLSPIPIPRATLDKENLLISLEWDPPAELLADGADSGLAGAQIWVYHDRVRDHVLTPPAYDPLNPANPYTPVTRVPAGATSVAISLVDILAPGAEGPFFALQLLYRSTPSPFDAFDRRSGYALVNQPGRRVEGLSGVGNGSDLGILSTVLNFGCAYDGGNRVLCTWDVPEVPPLLDHFEVLVAKSVAGLDIGVVPPQLAGATLTVPYDASGGPGQTLSALDRNAGRTGSKINVYILKAIFSDGTFLIGDPVVVDLTDIL